MTEIKIIAYIDDGYVGNRPIKIHANSDDWDAMTADERDKYVCDEVMQQISISWRISQ